MIRRFLASALLAGLAAGLLVTALQSVTTAPLIAEAERYEHAAPGAAAGAGHEHESGWAPADGMERLFFTALANVIAGTGFGLVLVACMMMWKGRPNGGAGVVWGMAGFAVFTLAPSLGLAPELPSMSAAGLAARQAWWIFAAAATAAGLWLLVFPGRPAAAAAGILLIALPHLIGAPHPQAPSTQVPPELAARFAAASIVTSAAFWACLGWLAGTLYARGADSEALP